jgi:hypothetical protein
MPAIRSRSDRSGAHADRSHDRGHGPLLQFLPSERMSEPLTLQDIPSAAEYAQRRDAWRAEVIAAKKLRTVAIGDNVTLLFENRTTVRYQVLEMLRIEKTTDAAGIQAELDAYNPLIPGGTDWRATMMIEFADAEERRVQLKYLRAVEHEVYAQIGTTRIRAVADEDMERSDAEKTAAVHFLRFPLPAQAIAALRAGAALEFAIDHPRYRFGAAVVDPAVRAALLGDLD